MHLPPLTHVAPLITIRRERRLPTYGKVLVRVGDRVEANDVVARAMQISRHRILDIARFFGVPPEAADSLLRVEPGDGVHKGQTLAQKRAILGLFARRMRAPFEGQVVATGDGRILLAARDEPIELRATLPGTVVNVRQGLSVLIEANGALIQGMWGSGRQAYGVLRVATTDPTQPLSAESLDIGYQDTIVVAGGSANREALQAAAAARVRGLVVGSMPGALTPLAQKLRFPILVTEGFGERIMPEPTWALLTNNNGREVVLDAYPTDRFSGRRPELIIPLPPASPPPPVPVDGEPLASGKRVRVLRSPYAGQVGVVVNLPEQHRVFASGLRAMPAEIEIKGRGIVMVPRVNLEIFEESLPES